LVERRLRLGEPGGDGCLGPCGVLRGPVALGDGSYANFCAFGRRLESWLLERGAAPLWERIDVDGADTAALRRWDEALLALAEADTAVRAVARSGAFAAVDAGIGGVDLGVDSLASGIDSLAPGIDSVTAVGLDGLPWADGQIANIGDSPADGSPFRSWRLVSREPMNPGSVGEPILRLVFEPVQTANEPPVSAKAATTGKAATAKSAATGKAATAIKTGSSTAPGWQPGDLAQLRIPAAGVPVLRDYSIASLPDERRIELFVRLQRDDAGRLGLASGWLSGIDITGLQPGGKVELKPRANPSFRLAATRDSPLILIGSGSGLAGLRALLRARERDGAGPNWLIFGERNEAHDFLCRDEIRAWQANGVLEHFDGVFSRDGATRRYVQHRLVERAGRLRRWITAGAAIHVCGSRERLAVGVDEAMARILGDEGFARLRESGRYRRDVW
ncbi:MAG TPA: hypothetical protein PK177_20960, partial [Burkholderiaceae bacterium]|nr:hypothetical protein [Burkholderiaceae bacterium]